MRHRAATLTVISAAVMLAAAPPAGAVVKGIRSHSLTAYTVRLVGDGYCSGVVIAPRLVVTARHCAYGMSVLAAHRYYRVAKVSRDGVLDDGRRVHVSGDASILHLSKPLPETIAAVPVGDGDGDNFIIAGYGGSGILHQANLVAAGPYALVDPGRDGAISASACFGDSGGPVLRGGVLVGVITRAAHPSPRRACGDLTRWAPISVSGNVEVLGDGKPPAPKAPPKQQTSRHHARHTPVKQAATAGWFGNWFVPNAETRHKTATR
jgi:Trypsin